MLEASRSTTESGKVLQNIGSQRDPSMYRGSRARRLDWNSLSVTQLSATGTRGLAWLRNCFMLTKFDFFFPVFHLRQKPTPIVPS